MKKTFMKNIFRDIKKTFSRFFSIVIIIALGVAFYAGVRATSPDMKMSGDFYLNRNNFFDFKIISTLGLTKEDLTEIQKLKGINQVEGSQSMDAIVEKDKHSLVLNVNSIPSEKGINKMTIVKGRAAKDNYEIVVEDRFMKENNFKIGDEIRLESGNDSLIGDKLKNSIFKIVGSAQSPLYISAQRQLSSIGNGTVRGFVYILSDVFKDDVFTEVYVKTDSDESKNSFLNNKKYDESTQYIENELKNIGISRNKIRYNEVLSTSQNKIKDAQDKLNISKNEAKDKFSDGYKELNEAKDKITQGKSEITKNQLLLNEKIAQGEKEINNGKKQIEDSKAKLNLGKQQAADNISTKAVSYMNDAKKLLDSDPTNPTYIAQYNTISQIYEKDIRDKRFDEMYALLKGDGVLEKLKSTLDIEALKNNFDNAESGIALGIKKINDSETQLNSEKREANIKLSNEIKKIQDGEKQINEELWNLKSEEEKANIKMQDAQIEIDTNKVKIESIKEPEWYVLGRSANVGYESYRQDSNRIDNIGKAFPLIFFLVAALVSLTTMTRMVGENRIEIGTFKALGYSRISIVAHYLIYAILASTIGSIIGISFGFRLFPPLIMNAYGSLYTIPTPMAPFNLNLAFQASLIAIFFTTIAAVTSTLEELRETPASLMRPKAPKAGKTILLERIPLLWRRLSFTKKVTARNIFRYKQRFFMTVIGIATCTGLMITGFGIKSGVMGAAESQFKKIYRYDMQSTLKETISDNKKDFIKNKIMENTNVKSALFTYTKNATVKTENLNSEDIYLVVTENNEELNKYINLTMKGKDIELGNEGAIITQKLSKLMNIKVGDTISITLNGEAIKVKVSAITEQYVQHYIYMSHSYYEKVTGKKLEYNGFYGRLNNLSDSAQESISKELTSIKDIGSISYKNNIHFDFNKATKSINSVILILIISAGVLAFVVIYNLTNININERKRELSTIKLLGFYDKELALYIYRENIILTIIGSLAGIAVGVLLNNFVINASETNIMMFLRKIDPIYFLYSVLLTISFSLIVNLAMYREFKNIDMIESLKNAE